MTEAHAITPYVIVVTDDIEYGLLAGCVFEELGLVPINCQSAEAAIEVLRLYGRDVAFVFTDVALPGVMDGTDLARFVPTRWPNAHVVLTARSEPTSLPEEASFVSKPWRAVDLIVEAERAVEYRPAA